MIPFLLPETLPGFARLDGRGRPSLRERWSCTHNMPHELPKAYEPGAIEARWAEYWVREKLFHVETPPPSSSEEDSRPVFTLLLPPPTNACSTFTVGVVLTGLSFSRSRRY